MHVEAEAATRGTHREEWLVPREATHDLPDRRTARNDREDGRATPGQVWLQQTCRAQPCAQRIEIAPTAPQNCFETIAATDERQRFNLLPPNGPRKSEVVLPRCQDISRPVDPSERFARGHAPLGHGDHGNERRAKSKGSQHLATPGAERGAAPQSERHVRSKLQRKSLTCVGRRPTAVEREQSDDRSGRVGAAAAHARPAGDALGEREARAAGETEALGREPCGAQDEVVATRGHVAACRARRAAARLGMLVPDAKREATRGARHLERVVERDRLEHGDEVVEAVFTLRPHGEAEVQLGVRVDGDEARRLLNRRPGPPDTGVPGPSHRATYRIHTVIATYAITVSWIGRSASSTSEGSSLISDTRTRCR